MPNLDTDVSGSKFGGRRLHRPYRETVLRMAMLGALGTVAGCWIGVPSVGDKGQKCFPGDRCLPGLVCRGGQCLSEASSCDKPDPTPDAAGPCQKRACDPATGWENVADTAKDGTPCGTAPDVCHVAPVCGSGVCQAARNAADPKPDAAGPCEKRVCDPSTGWQTIADAAQDGTPCGVGKCADGACFLPIDPGTFTMGAPSSEPGYECGTSCDDETQHQVTISQGFDLEATDVTQGEWQSLMGNNPSYFSSCGSACPVEQVSWWDAVAYANALSAKEDVQPCYTLSGCAGKPGDGQYSCSSATFAGLSCTGYRLPTEAEWEYAARAGTTTGTYNGTTDSSHLNCEEPNSVLDPIAWFCGNDGKTAKPVGQKQPNAWGLYDMLGNVWQWVWDRYADYPSGPVTDPMGPSTGPGRVDRGGSWFVNASYARAADRAGVNPAYRNKDLGFRLARSRP